MKRQYILIGIVSVFVLLSIIYGFTIIGFPKDTRGKKFDTTRVSNLRGIKERIDSYMQNNRKLPQSIQVIALEDTYLKINDPETGKPYEYYITGANSYKLCAKFSTSYEDSQTDRVALYDYSYTQSQFRYEKGYNCFPFSAASTPIYPYLTVTPSIDQSKKFIDKNIESVKTTAVYDQNSKFPEGFFSDDTNEFGLINYKSQSINLIVKFVKPVKLSMITNSINKCSTPLCDNYSGIPQWSAEGLTSDGERISLANNIKIEETGTESNAMIISDKEFTQITFRSFGPLMWKKMNFTYK